MTAEYRKHFKRTAIGAILYLGVIAAACIAFPAKAQNPWRAVPQGKVYEDQHLRSPQGAARTDMRQRSYQVDDGRVIVTEDNAARCYIYTPNRVYGHASPSISCIPKN